MACFASVGARRQSKEAKHDDDLSTAIATGLEPWFRRSHRDMPWRRTRDPYAIWVSEIMLQQTRVETVERYWGPFLERFPSIVQLAEADEQSVLQAWSGLGYYRRARLLHRGARYVVEHEGGRVPQPPDRLRAIPGIGEYTAGAIASIAFDRPVPLVDGNVARVLSRIEAVTDPKQQGATARRHWRRVAAILERGTPRVLAQALMELGATVCTPRSPQCLLCPVRVHCKAHRDGLVGTIPSVRKKVTQPVSHWLAPAIVWRGRLMMVRRPETGLLAEMWCLPLVPAAARPSELAELSSVEEHLAVPVQWIQPAGGEVRHVFTHRIWSIVPLIGRVKRKPRWATEPADRHCFIRPGEKPPGGLPRVAEKLLAQVGWSAAPTE